MLNLSHLSHEVKNKSLALVPNPNHPLGMGLAYRLLKEQGWKNHDDEIHPIDRVPVFRLPSAGPSTVRQAHGSGRSSGQATIRRDRSGRSHWLIEIGGQTYESSAGVIELTAAVKEKLRSERTQRAESARVRESKYQTAVTYGR